MKRRCLSDPRSTAVEPASQRNGRKLSAHSNAPERHRTSTKVLRRLGTLRSRTSNNEPRLSVPHCKTVDTPEQRRTVIGSKTVDTPELESLQPPSTNPQFDYRTPPGPACTIHGRTCTASSTTPPRYTPVYDRSLPPTTIWTTHLAKSAIKFKSR